MSIRRVAILAPATFLLWVLAAVAALAAPPAPPVAMVPPLAGQDARLCLDCHRAPNLATTEGALAGRAFCNECHGQKECLAERGGVPVPLWVDPQGFAGSRHQVVACQQCHVDVARSPHKAIQGVSCRACHLPHQEGSALHDSHLTVRCEACHHKSTLVMREAGTGRVALARQDAKNAPLSLADHASPDLQDPALCARCHAPGNPLNAPAMVLPAKGVICFLCHPATFGLGSGWFGLALLIFLAGLAALVRLWLRGQVAGQTGSAHQKLAQGSESLWATVFSRRFAQVLGVIFFDIILQRRLLQESVRRWFFHSLIYLSLLLRMALGLFTWLVTQMWPASSLALALMDKNQPFVAAFNDLLGLFMLLGVLLAAGQRLLAKPKHVLSEGQDALALAILGVMAALGFVLEAARLLTSALPADQAAWSFVAWPLSLLLGGSGANLQAWANAYGWLWWAHALTAALLVAYIPFGKMRHVFSAPLSLLLNKDRA